MSVREYHFLRWSHIPERELSKTMRELSGNFFDPRELAKKLEKESIFDEKRSVQKSEMTKKELRHHKQEEKRLKKSKSKKADEMRDKNKSRLEKELEEKDMEKLKNNRNELERVTMSTPVGEILQFLGLYKKALSKDDNTSEILDLYFEILQIVNHSKLDKVIRIFNDNKLIINEAEKLLSDSNEIKYQMIYLSDCMPPLNRRNITNKLDDWQKQVILNIKNSESVLICTPTSSGKTILTTILTLHYHKILFIVPNDALVRQVGSIFWQATGGCVTMISKTLYYISKHFNKDKVRDDICSVVVGTADWIERKLPDLYENLIM